MIFVLGNGRSRLGFDLNSISDFVVIGCNALYKEYTPTYLVAVDNKMIDEIQNSSYTGEVITSRRVDKENFRTYQTKFRIKAFCSGAFALDFAANLFRGIPIYLLGFDNLPKKNYKDSTIYINHPIYRARAGRWAHELFEKDYMAVMKYWKDTSFTNVIHPTLSNPMLETLGTLPNYKTITYDALVTQ